MERDQEAYGKTIAEVTYKVVRQMMTGPLNEEMLDSCFHALERVEGEEGSFAYFEGYADGASKLFELILNGKLDIRLLKKAL